MKLYLSDASIFLLAFIITLAILRDRQPRPRPDNVKPQTTPETAKDDPYLIIERSA